MTDRITPIYETAAGQTYAGDAAAPLTELAASARVASFGNSNLTAALGIPVNHLIDTAAPSGPRTDHGFNA
jgi:hypothetical protein